MAVDFDRIDPREAGPAPPVGPACVPRPATLADLVSLVAPDAEVVAIPGNNAADLWVRWRAELIGVAWMDRARVFLVLSRLLDKPESDAAVALDGLLSAAVVDGLWPPRGHTSPVLPSPARRVVIGPEYDPMSPPLTLAPGSSIELVNGCDGRDVRVSVQRGPWHDPARRAEAWDKLVGFFEDADWSDWDLEQAEKQAETDDDDPGSLVASLRAGLARAEAERDEARKAYDELKGRIGRALDSYRASGHHDMSPEARRAVVRILERLQGWVAVVTDPIAAGLDAETGGTDR